METKLPTNEEENKRLTNLPAIVDLYADEQMAKLENMNNLNILLNQPPAQSWIKKHPTAKNVVYIPVERIEYLMTRIFVKWRVEVKTVFQLANSVVVTVRVHYLDPVNGWEWQDGVGASPLQTESGAGAIDWNQIKSAAVQIATPAAESYAFKDACEKIGKLFGKDLNRKDTMNYDGLTNVFTQRKEDLKRKVEEHLQYCQDDELKTSVVEAIMDAEASKKDGVNFYMDLLSKFEKP